MPERRTADSGSGSWPTPTASAQNLYGMAPERRTDTARKQQVPLADAVRLWASPASRDYRSGKGRQENGHTPQLPEQVGGVLAPEWVEILMGYPPGWTALE